MEKKQGEVMAISPKNRGVLIRSGGEEGWLTLADNVKLEYVKKGECDYSIGDDGNVVFLKVTKENTNPNKSPFDKSSDNQQSMERQSALRTAAILTGEIYHGQPDKSEEALKFFKRLSGEIGHFYGVGAFKA